MKIVIAPDSYKGSLTSTEVGRIMEKACNKVMPHAEVVMLPMADGGEGTLETMLYAAKGFEVECYLTGPLGDKILSKYGVIDNGNTAVIEIAQIAGLPMISDEKRNPFQTTSYGIGEAIKDALNKGIRSFIIGLGGSATNDGGLGMLSALGAKFHTKDGQKSGIYGKDILTVVSVDFQALDPRIQESNIQVACDVDNPLCGDRGASYVFGPQKGATRRQVAALDQALGKYAEILETNLKQDIQYTPGAGAAGGLGFAFLAIGGKLDSGAKLAAEAIKLEEKIIDANLVITGEGQSDYQTMFGKAPGYVAKLAQAHNVEAILISGSLGDGYEQLFQWFSGCFSITRGPISLAECIEQANELLFEQTYNVLHFYRNKMTDR